MGNQNQCCDQGQNRLEYAQSHNSINPIKYGATVRNYKKFGTMKNPSFNHKQQNQKANENKNIFTANSRMHSSKQEQQFRSSNDYENDQKQSHDNSPITISVQDRNQHQQRKQDISQSNRRSSFDEIKQVLQKQGLYERPNPTREQFTNGEINMNRSKIQENNHKIQHQSYRMSVDSKNTHKQRLSQKHVQFFPPITQSVSNQSNYQRKFSDANSQLYDSSASQTKPKLSYQESEVQIEYLPIVKKVIQRQKPFGQQFETLSKSNIKKIRINNAQDIYQGQIDQNGRKQGLGIVLKKNGSVLIAKFQNYTIIDKAFFVFNNGSYYRGRMKDNMANDENGEFHSQQFSYRGNFVDNQLDGWGQEMGDDHYYKGQYSKGLKKRGNFKWEVKQTRKNSRLNQSQATSRSNKVQEQIVSSDNYFQKSYPKKMRPGDQQINQQLPPNRIFQLVPRYLWSYQGGFDSDQLFNGYGVLQQPKGTFKGHFFHGKKNGKGSYYFANRLKFEGEYLNDKKQGYGILLNYDDTLAYQGQWKDDLPNGNGYLPDQKGKKKLSSFINGISSQLLVKQHKKQKPQFHSKA